MLSTHLLRRTLVLVIAAAVVIGALGQVTPAAAGGNVGPQAMLTAYYYNHINQRDYWTAYQQWDANPQTYEQFIAGYADTSFVLTYFGAYQARGPYLLEGSVPGVLIGNRTNGSQVAYAGCYDVRYNPAGTGIAQWKITGADFTQLAAPPAYEAEYTQFLKQDCADRWISGGAYFNVLPTLSDYFEAVNNRDYGYAYNRWYPPQQTYDDFVAGWQDTLETVVFYGNYQFSGTFDTEETGRIPVVLMGYHTDGSTVAYQGCIGMNFDTLFARGWSLHNAYVQPMVLTTVPQPAAIQAALYTACY